jgi:hypothetical protein
MAILKYNPQEDSEMVGLFFDPSIPWAKLNDPVLGTVLSLW